MAGNGVRVKSRVVDRDRGFKRRLKELLESNGVRLTVGIHADQGGAAAKGADGLSVADLGAVHEFGLGVPARSFIGGWADRNKATNQKIISTLMKPVAAGKRTAEDALKIAGARFKGDIQRGFASPPLQELAESTKKAKGSDTPLIDTGQLRSSIDYQVTKKSTLGAKVVAEGAGIKGAKRKKAKAEKKARKKAVKAVSKRVQKATKSARKVLKTGAKKTAKTLRKALKGKSKRRPK